ncbi:YehS family protein [Neobacillus sp. Marseille-QA0830]
MDNNDILIRLRYALEIKNKEMAEIFKLGGVDVTVPEVIKILTKSDEDDDENDNQIKCNNSMFDSFLNGLIIFKRGKQEPKPGQPIAPEPAIKKSANVNNLLLKKVKIALALTTEDMLDIFDQAGITVSKGELGALLRKEGHKNYKECGDKFARNFLKGLAIKYRA